MVPEVLRGLDPRLRATVRGQVGDFLRGYCIYPGHPINLIEVCGVITEVHFQTHLTSFSVDDGTGLLPCIAWPDQGINLQDETIFSIGRCVTVQGKLSYNLNQNRQELSMRKLVVNYDVNAEAKFTLEVNKLKREVYQLPWSPPQFLLNQLEDIELNLNQSQSQSEASSTPSYFTTLLSHLTTLSRSEFRLDELLSDQHLLHLLQTLPPSSSTEASVIDILRSNFRLLVQEGFLHESRPRSDSYCILHTSDFHDAILTALRQYPPFQRNSPPSLPLLPFYTLTSLFPSPPPKSVPTPLCSVPTSPSPPLTFISPFPATIVPSTTSNPKV